MPNSYDGSMNKSIKKDFEKNKHFFKKRLQFFYLCVIIFFVAGETAILYGEVTGSKRRADSMCFQKRFLVSTFIILYGEVLKWSKRRDSKSRRALTRRVGSNPTFSAR